MLLSMLMRSPFVGATRFEFSGRTPSLKSGYGVADQMGKKDGFIEVFCRNPAAMRVRANITGSDARAIADFLKSASQ